MEKNLTLSPQELKLFLNSLSKDEDFRNDLEMVLKKDYKKFDEWLKTMHPMHFILEDLLVATWPPEFIRRYVEVINIDERLRKKLLQSAGKDIVSAILSETNPSADESNIVLNRPDGLAYIGRLLEVGADLDADAEKIILTRGTDQEKEKYCQECEELHNIDLLLKDEQSRRLLLLYINDNCNFEGFCADEETKLLPYPELMKAYTSHYNVNYQLVKDDPNLASYIGEITMYECDWVDICENEELFEKFVKSALKTDSQKESLGLAIDLYPDQLAVPTAGMLQKLNDFDDKLVRSLLKTTNEEALKYIPQKYYCLDGLVFFAENKKVNGTKTLLPHFKNLGYRIMFILLSIRNPEITQMLIEKEELPSELQKSLLAYQEPDRKALVLYYGQKYGFTHPEGQKAYRKYRRKEIWQKVKNFFGLG